MISADMASLHELSTIYGTEDLYDLLEIIVVDAYNQSSFNKRRKKD